MIDRTIDAMRLLGWSYDSKTDAFRKDDERLSYELAKAALDAAERGETWEYNEAANEP